MAETKSEVSLDRKLGLAVATAVIIVMYLIFTFAYTELACAIPKAGGAFTYATRAFGKNVGFLAGIAQVVEFSFAPPAIALLVNLAIGMVALFTGRPL